MTIAVAGPVIGVATYTDRVAARSSHLRESNHLHSQLPQFPRQQKQTIILTQRTDVPSPHPNFPPEVQPLAVTPSGSPLPPPPTLPHIKGGGRLRAPSSTCGVPEGFPPQTSLWAGGHQSAGEIGSSRSQPVLQQSPSQQGPQSASLAGWEGLSYI